MVKSANRLSTNRFPVMACFSSSNLLVLSRILVSIGRYIFHSRYVSPYPDPGEGNPILIKGSKAELSVCFFEHADLFQQSEHQFLLSQHAANGDDHVGAVPNP